MACMPCCVPNVRSIHITYGQRIQTKTEETLRNKNKQGTIRIKAHKKTRAAG